jgi:hypothetical protein
MRGSSVIRQSLLKQTRSLGRRQTQRVISSHGTRHTAPAVAIRALDLAMNVAAEVSIPRGWELDMEDDDGG